MKRIWIGSLSAMLLLVGAWTFAGEAPPPGPQRSADHAESRKLLEEVLMARLTRELALEDDQAVLLLRHMTEFRDRMTALQRARGEKMRALRQAVQEGKDEKKIGVLMEKVLTLNERMAKTRNEVINFEGFELSTWQQARLLIFLSDFEGDMRRLLRRARERRGGRGFPGPKAWHRPGPPPSTDGSQRVPGNETSEVAPNTEAPASDSE